MLPWSGQQLSLLRIIRIYVKILQPNLYLSSPGQSVTRLSDTDVQTELTDLEISHGIFSFGISHYQALYFDLKLLRAQYEKRRLSQQRPLENMDNTGFSFCYIPACCWLSSGVQECSGSPSSSTSPSSRRPPQWRPAIKNNERSVVRIFLGVSKPLNISTIKR